MNIIAAIMVIIYVLNVDAQCSTAMTKEECINANMCYCAWCVNPQNITACVSERNADYLCSTWSGKVQAYSKNSEACTKDGKVFIALFSTFFAFAFAIVVTIVIIALYVRRRRDAEDARRVGYTEIPSRKVPL